MAKETLPPEKQLSWQEMFATSNRPYEAYHALLGVSEEDLRGNTVLDLGAGENLSLSRGAKERGIETMVVSLNPQLAETEKWWGKELRARARERGAIAGEAENLPFRDGAFDKVYSLYAVPEWLVTDAEEYTRVFEEIDRVLKPGGEAVLFPCDHFEGEDWPEPLRKRQDALDRAIAPLREKGYAVTFEEVSPDMIRQYGGIYTMKEASLRLRLRKPVPEDNNIGE